MAFDLVLPAALVFQVAYSVDAQDHLGPALVCLIHAKPAVFRSVVPNPIFQLAGDSVLIPTKTDQQAQKQPCAPYWNADKELCLASHRELNAHDDVDRPDSSVQVRDTKWVFELYQLDTITAFTSAALKPGEVTYSVLL